MKKPKSIAGAIKGAAKEMADKTTACLGRKRDPAIDEQVLEATIQILEEKGFGGMTMDLVAAQAKAGKASLYRRWPSKAELVRDALIWMSRSSVDSSKLPDTGSLRGDLLAVVKPYSQEFAERKLRVMAGLGSFYTEHQQTADEVFCGIFESWTTMNRAIFRRAIERGEVPKSAPVDLLCDTIIALASHYKRTQQKPFDRSAYAEFLDAVVMPAVKK